MEIERKYLVKQLPENPEQYEKAEMEQGYLSTEPVVRVRAENDETQADKQKRQRNRRPSAKALLEILLAIMIQRYKKNCIFVRLENIKISVC